MSNRRYFGPKDLLLFIYTLMILVDNEGMVVVIRMMIRMFKLTFLGLFLYARLRAQDFTRFIKYNCKSFRRLTLILFL